MNTLAPFWFTKTFRNQECQLKDLYILTFQWYRKKSNIKLDFLNKKIQFKPLKLTSLYFLPFIISPKKMFEQLDKFDKFCLTKQNRCLNFCWGLSSIYEFHF